MRLLIFALVYAGLTYSAFSLGYPIPQPKACKVYWDSQHWLRIVQKDPNTVAYFFSPHEIIAKSKSGSGILLTHNEKGCLIVQQLHPRQVEKLLTRQGDA